MKIIKKFGLMILAVVLLCASLFGCGSTPEKQGKQEQLVYQVADWLERAMAFRSVYREDIDAWDQDVLDAKLSETWDIVNTVADNYSTVLFTIDRYVAKKENKLLSISFVVVPEASGTMTFSFYSQGKFESKNLQEQTVNVTAGAEKTVSFSFDKKISQIVDLNNNEDYSFYIDNARLVEINNSTNVPIGAERLHIDGKYYYIDYLVDINYKIKSVTLTFDEYTEPKIEDIR